MINLYIEYFFRLILNSVWLGSKTSVLELSKEQGKVLNQRINELAKNAKKIKDRNHRLTYKNKHEHSLLMENDVVGFEVCQLFGATSVTKNEIDACNEIEKFKLIDTIRGYSLFFAMIGSRSWTAQVVEMQKLIQSTRRLILCTVILWIVFFLAHKNNALPLPISLILLGSCVCLLFSSTKKYLDYMREIVDIPLLLKEVVSVRKKTDDKMWLFESIVRMRQEKEREAEVKILKSVLKCGHGEDYSEKQYFKNVTSL